MAIPLSLALNRLAGASLSLSLLTLVAFICIATWLCKAGEGIFQQKDCPKIVIDEVTGFLLANFSNPAEFKSTLLAFLLFRFFDIIKPFPAARAEKLSGGLGVILDDLIAGLYTFAILRPLFFGGWV